MLAVVIIHHHPMIRLGIAAMLESVCDIELVAHGDTPAVIPRDDHGQPDADVLIVAAPDARDDAVAKLIREAAGRVPVLTVTASQHYDTSLIDLRDGVFGCVTANVSRDQLTAAVRTVARRRRYVPRAVSSLLRLSSQRRSWTLEGVKLSPRERQVLALIAQGFTHHQVATRMGIAKTTVETYVERIREKLRLGNKAELTLAALTLLLPSSPTRSQSMSTSETVDEAS